MSHRLRTIALTLLSLLTACEASTPPGSATSAAPATPPGSATPSTPSATPSTPSPARTTPSDAGFEVAEGIHYLVRYSGRASAGPTVELPMVVAIHGLGDRPERFQLFGRFPIAARVIVPRALKPHGDGYSWFDISVRDPDQARVAEGMKATTDKLAKMIEAVAQRYPTQGKPIVTGFSQGGMLSFALATRRPELVAAAIPLAGVLPESLRTPTAPEAAPPIIALHGDADPVLPIGQARDTVGALKERGWNVTLLEYPGVRHQLRGDMQRELYRRVRDAMESGSGSGQ